MKTLSLIVSLTIIYLSINHQTTFAGLQKPDESKAVHNTKRLNSDSLPNGVTKDWLNDLRDENGERISNIENSSFSMQISEDPEEDALQRKIFSGLSAGSQFGVSVSSAGDVNGDGFDDIIIGAYLYNSNTGRAYIYFGGINLNTTADVILTGEAASNVFGCSVSCAGDVNGDGYSDVIVGAYGYSSNKGRAYVFFGGTLMNNTADIVMTGEFNGNDFGASVSTAGDVNGDGYSDVIVSADLHNSNTGKAYIFYGGSSMNNMPDVTMTGNSTSDTFGKSVSVAGDVNGDGFSDVIIGANGYSSNTGRAYIFMGGVSMDNTADVLLTGEAAGNNFGVSVSTAGDVNGDGFSDVICGAYGFSSNTGKAYIYFGGAGMNSTSDVTMSGESTFNFFGNSVSNAGDVNGDGYTDVIISEFGYNSFTGKAFIFFGGTTMNNIADITMNEEIINSYFGISVASAGDVNADGFSDIVIGAYGYGSNTGRAYFYDYFMKNEIIPDLTITGEGSSNFYGTSVSDAGDVNGDGFGDVIVGAYGYNSITGRAYIYFGGSNMDNSADVVLTGEAAGNAFGISVSAAGDVNGDGYSDVIAGAPGYNSNRGRAYIYFGGNAMNNIADVIMTGLNTNDEIGREVSNTGDLNGDGYYDVAVSAPFINKVYIYYGSASMNNAADITLNMSVSSIAPAGDVNGDGFSDLITGVNISGNGNAYVYYGGENPDNISDLTFSGEANGDAFGASVSAGDFNADGYSDLIVGAFGCNSYTGKAYIFTGSEQTDIVPDVTMTGETANNLFGASVSAGRDINGDGFSDIIVGGEGYNSNSGKCYVFFGGRMLNNSPDAVMKGEPASNFGDDVSLAGDLNGDGYSDVVTGAKNYNLNTGKSFIYTGSAVSVKPNILSVKDLSGDQGGYVNVKFARSAFDIPFSETDGVNYQIERSSAPNISGYHWASVATVLGTHNTVYTAEVHTPLDSGNLSNNTYFFRITAVSNTTSSIWRSNILSGYSIDNIAPPLLTPFTATAEISNVRLNWKRSSASDLMNYVLFRSVSPVIDPYSETPLSSLTDSTFLDTTPLSGLYYYFAVAQDIHNNYSPVAVAQAPVTPKSLFLFGAIQGFYDAVSNTMIYDTVTIYLRSSTFPFAKIDSSKKEMYGPGTGQMFSFNNAQNGTPYYIEVKHRNALETWSADPIAFAGDYASIAFSVDAIYAFGSNEIQVDNHPYNVFAFFSGDINQDGTIDASDLSGVENDIANSVSGYVVTDINGDDFVDASDMSIVENNAAIGVSVITP